MAYSDPNAVYQQILHQIKTNPNWAISDPFYNSLFFGTKLELQYLPNVLQNDEQLFYITSGTIYSKANKDEQSVCRGHELLVITNNRLLFLDKKLFRSCDYDALSYTKINDIHVHHSALGIMNNRLQILTGNDHEIAISNMWGKDADRAYNAIERVRSLYYSDRSDQDSRNSEQNVQHGASETDIDKLLKLKGMLDNGELSQEEFNKLKQEILAK